MRNLCEENYSAMSKNFVLNRVEEFIGFGPFYTPITAQSFPIPYPFAETTQRFAYTSFHSDASFSQGSRFGEDSRTARASSGDGRVNLANDSPHFFPLPTSADQPYRCGVSSVSSGDSAEYRASLSVSITLMMCLLVSPVLTASLTDFKTVFIALRCSTVIGLP